MAFAAEHFGAGRSAALARRLGVTGRVMEHWARGYSPKLQHMYRLLGLQCLSWLRGKESVRAFNGDFESIALPASPILKNPVGVRYGA